MATDVTEQQDRKTKTPAFRALQNHSEKVRSDIRDGFESREAVMLWLLDVSKFTLGWVPDEFALTVMSNPHLTRSLIQPGADTPPTHAVQTIVEQVLNPAFNSTRGWLRSRAQDHDSEVDADRQAHTALIPRVDHVATVQRRTIEAALGVDEELAETPHHGPVENRVDISRWTSDLSYATQGFVPNELILEVEKLGSAWRYSLTNTRGVSLQRRIARDILPAMNSAVYYASETGMEQAEKKRGGNSRASIS